MDLFNNILEKNILPFDGEVIYLGKIFNAKETTFYYQELLNKVEWKNDEALMYGKLIITKRKVAWYADSDFEYTYSNKTKKALPWTPELLIIKNKIETLTNSKFNACLLNLYHDGNEGVSWHSDDEVTLQKEGNIASISFGAERKFSFKHKSSKETVSILLENGSLLLMKGETQENWLHSLPKTTKIKTPRINLTFRTMVQG